MNAALTFPLLDELAFEQTMGAWQGIHDELGRFYGDAIAKLQAALAEWDGEARILFLRWWWGGDGRTDSNQGAKGDVAILLQVVDDIAAALSGFRDAVAGINGWLNKANLLIDEHTVDGVITLHDRSGNPPGHFGIVGGFMSEQTVPGCYIRLEPSMYVFPYNGQSDSNFETPAWWTTANGYAANAVGEFNAACQTAISRLSDVQSLAARVHWLKPFTQPTDSGYPVLPYQDPVWALISGGMERRPDFFKPGNILGTVTYKDGKVVFSGDGDPFDPANVPSGYFGPDLFDKIGDVIEKYGLDALSVLLVGVGLVEGAAIIDTVVDSSAFVSSLFDAVAGRSIVGVVLEGTNLVVDSGAVRSVSEVVAEDMLGGQGSKLWSEFGDKLVGVIEQRIEESALVDGRYHIDPETLTTPTAADNSAANNAGYNSVVAPVANDHPAGEPSPGVPTRS